MKNFFYFLLCLSLSLNVISCSKVKSTNKESSLGFTVKNSPLFGEKAEWLWDYQGSLESLRKEFKLSYDEMFFIAYKYAGIGNYRLFEETLLYVIDKSKNTLITSLSAQALLEYWQANRFFDKIALYGEKWQNQFSSLSFNTILAEAYYWQRSDEKAWNLFQEIQEEEGYKEKEEYLLFRTVLALRLGKVSESKILYNSLIRDIPVSVLHERLWSYLQVSPLEAGLLSKDELDWLDFKYYIFNKELIKASQLLSHLVKGDSKDWLLSKGLISDFSSLYSSPKEALKGQVFLIENYSHEYSPFYNVGMAILSYKQREYEIASQFYKDAFSSLSPIEAKDYYYYYLRSLSFISVSQFLAGIGNISEDYLRTGAFYRLFDIYLNELVEVRSWDDVYDLYLGTKNYLSGTYQSRLALFMARLIEHKYLNILGNPEDQKAYFYDLAKKGDPLSYGSFMAIYFTNGNLKDILPMESDFPEWGETDLEINKVLRGFLSFGLAKEAYKFQRKHASVITEENYLYLSRLLGSQFYWFDAIEVATRLAARKNWVLTKDELEALYPRPFLSSIRYWAANYDVSLPVRLGQIHDESRFDPNIKSPRDAVGISQLLPSTAADIARELNVFRYSINDPEDNIRFGTYYLAKRFNQYQAGFKALLAYNAGYTRVDQWDKEFSDLPDEIYIEAVPFWESRRYVRSILFNAGVYVLLYGEERDFKEQVVSKIFNF